MSTSNYWN